jgi:hypothetical protein
METEGYGKGLLAGVLLALLVVGIGLSSSFSFGLFGSFTATPAENVGAVSVSSTSTASTVSSSTAYGASNSENGTNGVPSMVTTTTTQMSTTPGIAFVAQQVPSRVDNLSAQSASTNAAVLLPILVAFLLGAAAFRVTRRNSETDEPSST